jgi:hypothetical protein
VPGVCAIEQSEHKSWQITVGYIKVIAMFVTLTVLSLAVLMIVAERLKPGRVWPTVGKWWTRAGCAT